ncbi:SDR family oxidoreductase [Streptomyces sp. B1866]|uniref:SDR family oxidoreductase n=1 Tax=Streptomyces sp. B1866 TaxID=3075431 RepID=UPI00288ECA55|nr:SDR family oxidoreductase [Streptomyces sp. B1866]MDT3395069.1 SDR family oxidoreductase [Streptomyces sp. B1866]
MTLPAPTPRARAVVTGASSGIGAALAAALARRGHHLVLVARREDRLRDLAARLTAAHRVEAEVRACDLADRAARQALAAELAGREVAVLCNNAGFGTYGPLSAADPARELRQAELNAVAVLDLTLAVLPGMIERRAGAILVTGSAAGNQPGPRNTTYAATKAFANNFAESLHYELKGTGVGCTLLAPGPVRTGFADAAEVSRAAGLVPGPLWMPAERAAELAVRGLAKGRARVVPGGFAKAQTVGGRFGPRALVGPLLRRAYERAT